MQPGRQVILQVLQVKHLRLAVNCFLMILTFLDLDIWLKAENQSISTYKGF